MAGCCGKAIQRGVTQVVRQNPSFKAAEPAPRIPVPPATATPVPSKPAFETIKKGAVCARCGKGVESKYYRDGNSWVKERICKICGDVLWRERL